MSSTNSSTPKSYYYFLTPTDFDANTSPVDAAVVWNGLKEQTTAHGIPHITHAKGPIKKAFWILITTLTVAALLYNLYAITKSYFSFKVDVTIKLRHENELTFPAVTVCNMSPVKKSTYVDVSAWTKRRRKREASHCPDGWVTYLDHCYWKSNDNYTYAASVDLCQSVGGQISVIRDNDQYTFIKSISVDSDPTRYWLGFYYNNITSSWNWPDGGNVTFFDWSPDEPTHDGSCVVITETGYVDTSCDVKSKVICAKGQVTRARAEQTSEGTCCCTCCVSSLATCGACTGPNATNAAHCAAAKIPAPSASTTPAPTFTSTTSKPKPVPGSRYPERILPREDFQKEEKLTEVLANLDQEEKRDLGYTSNEMILDCQYSGYTCDISEFSMFYNPILGNCYVFNSGWDNRSLPIKKSLKAGRRHGLHLIININQDEYVKEVGDTAGLRLVIHPQTRMPFPEDEGITVSPGHATSIGIKQVALGRESKPYSDCVDPNIDRSDINVYEELYPKTRYSANACQRTCYQQNVIRQCGCGDPTEPLTGKAIGAHQITVKACDSSNITQDDCRYRVRLLYNNNTLDCNCPDVCRDISYSLGISLGDWPSLIQKDSLLEKLAPKIGNSFDITDPEEYKDNLAKVEVYYEEFNYEQIQERPSYPASNYLSDIGGVLGLWVGFSILTIFEFVELSMDLVMIMYRKCSRRRSPSAATGDPLPVVKNPAADELDMKRKARDFALSRSPGYKQGRKTRTVDLPLTQIGHGNSWYMRTGHSTPEDDSLPEPGGMKDPRTLPDHRIPPPAYTPKRKMALQSLPQVFPKS